MTHNKIYILEDIKKIFKEKKEYRKTDWLFLIKTIFIFFRSRHVLLDDELDAIDEVILHNPTSTDQPINEEHEEESTPDLILKINTLTKRNRKSGSFGSSRKSSRDSSSSIKTPQSSKSNDSNRSVFDFDESSR